MPEFFEVLRTRRTVRAYNIFYGAPALVVVSGDPAAPTAAIDCQLAMENLFLAARAKGLGTCYMGWLLMAARIPELTALLGVSDGHEMQAAAIVGHPAVPPDGPPQRRPVGVRWME